MPAGSCSLPAYAPLMRGLPICVPAGVWILMLWVLLSLASSGCSATNACSWLFHRCTALLCSCLLQAGCLTSST